LKLRSANLGLVVLLSLPVLTSCATTDPYPDDWPAAVASKKGDCSSLIGTFNNGYSKSSSDAIPMEGGLIVLLVGQPSRADSTGAKPVTRVTIEYLSPDRLLVTGLNFSQPVRQEERRISRSSCLGKGLPISGKFSGTNAENVLGFVSASGHLQRSANGDLVGRIRSTFTGVALLVPMTSSATSWYRFRRIEPDPKSTDPME